jgi:hypothetical protein
MIVNTQFINLKYDVAEEITDELIPLTKTIR